MADLPTSEDTTAINTLTANNTKGNKAWDVILVGLSFGCFTPTATYFVQIKQLHPGVIYYSESVSVL